ncbi:hypothetical protein KA344_14630, partial [bacterium]|nr:hypothetical protein [bacterium]
MFRTLSLSVSLPVALLVGFVNLLSTSSALAQDQNLPLRGFNNGSLTKGPVTNGSLTNGPVTNGPLVKGPLDEVV